MTLDISARNAALKLIAKFGKSITYSKVSAGEYNTVTGAAIPTSTDFAVKALVEDYQLRNSGQFEESGLVVAGDKKVSVAASALAELPTTGDTVTFDGVTRTVKNVKITYSGELAALYELQCRK